MKRELFYIAVLLYWFLLGTLVLPYLISADNTELVVLGFALLGVSAYATYRYARKLFLTKPTTEGEKK